MSENKNKSNAINRMYLHAKGIFLTAGVINNHAPKEIHPKYTIGNLSSEVMLLCLASEILLKLVHLHKNNSYEHDHNLYELFNGLGDAIKKDIFSYYKISFDKHYAPRAQKFETFHLKVEKTMSLSSFKRNKNGVDSRYECFQKISSLDDFISEIRVFSLFFVEFRYFFEQNNKWKHFNTGTCFLLASALLMFVEGNIINCKNE